MELVVLVVAAELVGIGKLAGLGLRERLWVETVTCLAVPVLGSIKCRLSSSQVSAYERFKEAGEDIGGVRTLMELTSDVDRYRLFCHSKMRQTIGKASICKGTIGVEQRRLRLCWCTGSLKI